MELRDYSTSLWSQPVRSRQLEKAFYDNRAKPFAVPKLHSAKDVAAAAQQQAEVQRLTVLCQKASEQRTQEDVSVIRTLVCAMCPFFAMWPGMLQEELARMLTTEVLVTRESVLSRGLVPTKLFIVLSGKLHVLGPDIISPDRKSTAGGMSGAATRGAGRTTQPGWDGMSTAGESSEGHQRVMAVLRRGDTCGEAVLLGPTASHADVVVGSNGAVLLSLALPDFLQAFKEILGLRQQDRLEFLRTHPLFQGVPLGELDMLAEELSATYLPPRALLLPRPAHEAPRTHLLAEGVTIVKRVAGTGGGKRGAMARALAAAASLPDDDGGVRQMYDGDTVSVLQPTAVLGNNMGQGLAAITVTQVKAFWLPTSALARLPARIKTLLESADTFWGGYQAGRGEGLACMDVARRHPNYGAYTYKVGDVVMSSIGQATSASAPAPGGATADTATPASPSWTNTGPRETAGPLSPLSRDPAHYISARGMTHTPSSPPGSRGMSPRGATAIVALNDGAGGAGGASQVVVGSSVLAAKRQAVLHALSAQQVLNVMDASSRRDPKTGLTTSNLQIRRQQIDADAFQGHASMYSSNSSHSPNKLKQLLRKRNAPLPDALPPAVKPQQDAPRRPALGMLHPKQTTWARITGAKHVCVHTEPPRKQEVPQTIQQRMATIHHQAVLTATSRPPTRDPYGYDDGSDGEEEGILAGHMQPSRRLSGDPRSRLSRTASRGSHRSASYPAGSQMLLPSLSGGPSDASASTSVTGAFGYLPADHSTISTLDLLHDNGFPAGFPALSPNPNPTPSPLGIATMLPGSVFDGAMLPFSSSSSSSTSATPELWAPDRQTPPVGPSTAPPMPAQSTPPPGANSKGSSSGAGGSTGNGGGVNVPGASGLNGTLRSKGVVGQGGAGGVLPEHAGGAGGAQPGHVGAGTPPPAFVQERTAHDLQDDHPHHRNYDAPEMSVTGGGGHGGSVGGQHALPSQGDGIVAGGGHAAAGKVARQSGETGGGGGRGENLGVPASVVLGYEKMDPLQWATLASHAPATIRFDMVLGARAVSGGVAMGMGSGGMGMQYMAGGTFAPAAANPSDGLLPPPKW